MTTSRAPGAATVDRFGIASCVVFAVTLVLFIATTVLFDSQLGNQSLDTQRLIGFATLVLPFTIGAILGVIGIARSQPRKILSIVGLIINTAAALFFGAVLLLAG